MSLGTSPIFATLPAPRKSVTLLTPRDQWGLSPDPRMTVPWINHWMPDYVFASFPLLASNSLCLAVGLGHSQSLPSHMVLGGQCQSLSNSQTFAMAAQREASLSTLSSIANIWHNSLAQHFFVSNQSINVTLLRFEAHMVYSVLLWKNQQHSDKFAKNTRLLHKNVRSQYSVTCMTNHLISFVQWWKLYMILISLYCETGLLIGAWPQL